MNYIKQTYGENTTCDFKEAVERKQPKSWLKRHIATMAHIIYVGVGKNGHWEVLSSQDVPRNVPRNVPQDVSVNDSDVIKDVVKDVAQNVAQKSKKQ